MNKITKIFNNIGFYCSLNNDIFIPNTTIQSYQSLDNTAIGYYIPYLVRNIKDNIKWETGVGEVIWIDGKVCVKRNEISSSSNKDQKINFIGNQNEFYLFVNNINFNSSFNNVILKNDHFNIDNITTIYLVDNSEKTIDCILPVSSNARNVVVDIKALSNNHNVKIRNNNGEILTSINDSIRLVSDGQSWYIYNRLDNTINFGSLSNEPTFSAQLTPQGNDYSFQYKDGNDFVGSELYWSSGSSNKLLLGSSSETNAHTILPTSGADSTIFNQDLQASDFIVYGSGQPYRNLFFSYDGRVGINIPSGSRPQTIFHVVNYSCSEILRLENRTSCQPAKLTIYNRPSTLNNNDICSIINLGGRDNNNNPKEYAKIYSIAKDVINGNGGLVLSVSSGSNDQPLVSGDLSSINIGYNNNKIIISQDSLSSSGNTISLLANNSGILGTSNSNISFQNNGTLSLNYSNLLLGSGTVTSNGTLSSNNLVANNINLPNIAASSLLALSSDKDIIPINGIGIDLTTNNLIFNNISGNKFLTLDSNNRLVGNYSLDDYFLTEKDVVWNKYNPRSCSICLKQVIFDPSVPVEEFSVGDQIEINTGSTLFYRVITDIILQDNNISELILDQNVTTNTVSSITVVSITKGGFLTIEKNTTGVASDSTSNILSIRPFTSTVFNTSQKNIDFIIYGNNEIPAIKVYSSAGAINQPSGTYYLYATANNNISSIPVNFAGSGINNNFSSANFNYNASNNLFSGVVSSVGSNGISSYYNTYDQNGNVAEWVQSTSGDSNNQIQYAAGGSYQTVSDIHLNSIEPAIISSGYQHIGFRVASTNTIIDNNTIANTLNFDFSTIHDSYNIASSSSIYVRSTGNPNSYSSSGIENLGVVNQSYRISIYETTNNQYAQYLNIVATGINATSSGLYDTRMGSEVYGGILRSSDGSEFSYTVKNNMSNKPVTFVSYINVLKYINWLHNGTPNSFVSNSIEDVLENGAYSILTDGSNYLVNINNHKKYFLPTLDQWYKAAYFKPESLSLVAGKPVVSINTDIPHIVATELLEENSTEIPKQIVADLTVSGWLVVDKIIVRDGTISSSLNDIGFNPVIPSDPNDNDFSQSSISPNSAPPLPRDSGGFQHSLYWNNSTASPRRDGVYGEISPPLPPDGTESMLELSCSDSQLILDNNLPFWCVGSGRLSGPKFY